MTNSSEWLFYNGQGDLCVFCARVAAREYDDSVGDVVRFEPLNPVTPGHVLFVPTRHVTDAADLPGVTGRVFAAAADFGRFRREPFNLITSAGSAATQTVRHLHVHYVPRRVDDGLHLPWTGQARPGDTGGTE